MLVHCSPISNRRKVVQFVKKCRPDAQKIRTKRVGHWWLAEAWDAAGKCLTRNEMADLEPELDFQI